MIIYCINCVERNDRFKQASIELNENGFKNINWIRNKRDKIGDRGVLLSHIDCYKDFLKSNDETCLIFEDDVKFIHKSKNNKDNILNTVNKINTNYDVLFIGYKY